MLYPVLVCIASIACLWKNAYYGAYNNTSIMFQPWFSIKEIIDFERHILGYVNTLFVVV